MPVKEEESLAGGEATPPCRCSRKPCSVFSRCKRRCDHRSKAVCCPESDEVLPGVWFMGAVLARDTTDRSLGLGGWLRSCVHRGEGEACAGSSNTGLARSLAPRALSSRLTTVEERPSAGVGEAPESSKKEKLVSSGRMATERRSIRTV